MASNTIRIYPPASSKHYYELSINAYENPQTEEQKRDNYSTINIIGTLKSVGINFSGGTNHTMSLYWYDDNINQSGAIVSTINVSSISLNGSVNISGTNLRANHKADGTLKGYAKVVFTKVGNNSYVPPTSEVQTSWFALNTIPRATILSNKVATIGKETTISWTKASPSFTHKLEYTFGSHSGVIGTDLVDNVKWTPNDNLYSDISNSLSGTGTLKLTTYNGDTITGTSTATLTLNADETKAKANITTANIVDSNNTTKTLTNDQNKLVLNASIPKITLNFITKKYAKAKEIKINGISYSLPSGTTSGENTTYSLTKELGVATTGSYDIVVTDTRDFKTTHNVTKTTINYIPLDYQILFRRVAPTTGQVGVTFDGNYFNGSFGSTSNSLTISYKYKKQYDSNYSQPINLTNNTDYKIVNNTFHSGSGTSKSQITLSATFDYKFVYNLQFIFEDKLTKRIVNLIVAKGIPIVWWNETTFTVNGSLNIADENGENSKNIFDKIYPIGSYYETSDLNFNPNNEFYGSWQLDNDGSVLVSKSSLSGSIFNDTIGTIVGEEKHKLTIEEMPKHKHSAGARWGTAAGVAYHYGSNGTGDGSQYDDNLYKGGDQPHNIVQPSKIVNRWHRVS